jgi:hypothetical protein
VVRTRGPPRRGDLGNEKDRVAASRSPPPRAWRDLDADTDRIWAERRRIVEDARGLAGQLIALAEAAIERFRLPGRR